MFKILIMKDGQWLCTEKQLVLILKMMIQPLVQAKHVFYVLTPFFAQLPRNVNGEEVEDVLANCNDHDKGELINIV